MAGGGRWSGVLVRAVTPTLFTLKNSPEKTRAELASTPWAVKLFNDPTLEPFHNTYYQPSTSLNSFIGDTLSTRDTISAWQSFQKKPGHGGTNELPEVLAAIKIGSGVNGYFDTCHGGFISLLLDEVTSNTADLAREESKATMTAYLNVQYKKPVRTPGVILLRAKVVKREGRKLWVEASIEDGEGGIMATAEALFLIVEMLKPIAKL